MELVALEHPHVDGEQKLENEISRVGWKRV